MFSWLSTGQLKGDVARLERECARLRLQLQELSTKLSTTAGAALTVRIGELEAAVDALQRSNRRELGRLWKLVGREEHPPETPTPAETADATRARLREQLPIPRIGGKKDA